MFVMSIPTTDVVPITVATTLSAPCNKCLVLADSDGWLGFVLKSGAVIQFPLGRGAVELEGYAIKGVTTSGLQGPAPAFWQVWACMA